MAMPTSPDRPGPQAREATPPGSEAGWAARRVYFPELDGLRAVAIALVYIFHDRNLDLLGLIMRTLGLIVSITLDPLLELLGLGTIGFRLPSLVGTLRDNGWIGVQIFFVLSGYLIATLLLRERSRYGRVDLRAFWIRRLLRIWPLYYLLILICWGLMPLIRGALGLDIRMWSPESLAQLPYFMLFLGNWSMGFQGPVPSDSAGVLWSICVEEQFYLFVPLLIAWVGPKSRVALVILMMAVAIAARYALAMSEANPLLLRFNTIVHLDTLLAGVTLALVTHRLPNLGRAGPWIARGVVLLGVVVVLTVPLARGGPWRQAIDYVLIWGWGIALVAWAASARDPWTAVLRRPTLVWLGKISFGLYLFHEIALGIAGWLGFALRSIPDMGTVMVLASPALTVGLASLSYYAFERPFLRLKDRWTRVPSRPIEHTPTRVDDQDHPSPCPATFERSAGVSGEPPRPA
ncbi:acyltransferase family protein [Tautonia rosea]|uniref:acyltransferase family protein n=1 Tax=Tautonia rosea TaxID=2728037 RepID=UPI001F2C589C|nr:acyltransferase [Tautonia rosea]